MADIGYFRCPTCQHKEFGRFVADPGLPIAIKAHKLQCEADTLVRRAAELRQQSEALYRDALAVRHAAGLALDEEVSGG